MELYAKLRIKSHVDCFNLPHEFYVKFVHFPGWEATVWDKCNSREGGDYPELNASDPNALSIVSDQPTWCATEATADGLTPTGSMCDREHGRWFNDKWLDMRQQTWSMVQHQMSQRRRKKLSTDCRALSAVAGRHLVERGKQMINHVVNRTLCRPWNWIPPKNIKNKQGPMFEARLRIEKCSYDLIRHDLFWKYEFVKSKREQTRRTRPSLVILQNQLYRYSESGSAVLSEIENQLFRQLRAAQLP